MAVEGKLELYKGRHLPGPSVTFFDVPQISEASVFILKTTECGERIGP